MSSFICEKCGKNIIDSDTGYITECDHYPMERMMSNREQTMTSTITTYYRPAQPKVRKPQPYIVRPIEELTPHDPVSHKCPVKNPRSIVRVQRRDGCVYETAAVNVGWGPKGYGRYFQRPEYEIIGYTETGKVALSMEAMSRAQAKS